MTMEYFVSLCFVLIALILLVVLTFLYKLTLAMGRLDKRLERLTLHLRDLNLYDLHPEDENLFGGETEMESAQGESDPENRTSAVSISDHALAQTEEGDPSTRELTPPSAEASEPGETAVP